MKRLMVAMMMLLAFAVQAKDYGSHIVTAADHVSIYDGDTLYLDVAGWPPVVGQHIGVRINGLDTPEMHSHCQDEQAKAREEAKAIQARQALEGILAHAETVELRNINRDKYFRILADVYADDANVADRLISAGLAVEYHGEKKVGWCSQ